MSNLHQQLQYYIPGIVLSVVSLVILFVWDATLSNFLLGMLLAGAGLSLCLLGYWKGQSSKEKNLFSNNESTNVSDISNNEFTNASQRSIHMQSGTYNESVQGNYITIQGNQIYINQDFSQSIEKIQETLSQIQKDGYSLEAAKRQVKDELMSQTENSKVRETLFRWGKSIRSLNEQSTNIKEVVERIIEVASESPPRKFYDPILVVDGKYDKLQGFLKNHDWKAADEETSNLVLEFLQEESYLYLDVHQIRPKNLKTINQLWLRFSNERFGLSVQQSIWKKTLKDRNQKHTYLLDDYTYFDFIDRVGWSREKDRIYHTDFEYSLMAPKGHLPASIMLESDFYCTHSNYCHLNKIVFDELMQRKY